MAFKTCPSTRWCLDFQPHAQLAPGSQINKKVDNSWYLSISKLVIMFHLLSFQNEFLYVFNWNDNEEEDRY